MDIARKQLQHQETLQATSADIALLLSKQALIKELAKRQVSAKQDILDSLLVKQQDAELARRLQRLHPADIGYVLENLPLDQRKHLWGLIDARERGAVLLELSDNARNSLLDMLGLAEIIEAVANMDASQLADFIPGLPEDVARNVLLQVDQRSQQQVRETPRFPKDSIGSLMDKEMITAPGNMSLAEVMKLLHGGEKQYAILDQVYVTAPGGQYLGCLVLKKILFNSPEIKVEEIMDTDRLAFFTNDSVNDAVSAFERYDLISAPVLNIHNQVVGNLSVNRLMEYLGEQRELQQLKNVGLSEEEIFTPVWQSARNRWVWLGLNLITAFIASRVIGIYESTIGQLVALATLMPIVASMGGNTGNQTIALMVRNIALNRVNKTNFHNFFSKEITVSMINGLLWGLIVAFFAFAVYGNGMLSVVMLAAMVINLLVAAIVGTVIPFALNYSGHDPVMGSSILLTAVTDSMGYFIFLGLASMLLIPA